ncbi:MAG TPA: hypothetical protein VFW07_12925 [Parafilimonas sp.]|nr:hypothetical protein [Parafilimonas sp.]
MDIISPSYYFTKVDPDYSIKGSRDPLGFQVVWQQQGRQLIPFLSTVSGNLQDFQILCLAHYLYGSERDLDSKFFIRFEQLMSYVRLIKHPGTGFNGISRTGMKLKNAKRVSLSNTPGDELLSNQRAYGIWGKYSRPFRDIGFTKDAAFKSTFRQKTENNPAKEEFKKLFSKIKERDSTKIEITELDSANSLLDYSKTELEFYDRLILKVDRANPWQNYLYDFLNAQPQSSEFVLYPFLKSFGNSSFVKGTDLQRILLDIENTEKILSPLNRIFRYIQTKPLWTRDEILTDEIIHSMKSMPDYLFPLTEQGKLKNYLLLTLQKDNWSLIEDLVKRNLEVTKWRGGAPWLTISGSIVEVHEGDGGFVFPDYNPQMDNDNYYFLDTYRNLFKQIHG